MNLRTRLIISFTGLLLAAIVAVGVVASRSVRSVLTAQIDQRLSEVAARGIGRPRGFEGRGPFPNTYALVVADETGEVLISQPAGFQDDPEPLPDIEQVPQGTSGFMYLPANGSSLKYRALVARAENGRLAVLAVPLRDLTDARSQLVRTLAAAGGGILAIGAFATWWTVKRGLRPVDRMVDTASAIAAGDLTRRVPDSTPSTELGRLGEALNEMLTHIEDAIDSERKAKDRLRQFVADASHELRTPVAAIAGYAELHRKGGLDDPNERQRALGRIEAETHRMQRLVEDLLLLARLDQTQPIDRTEVNLTALVADAVADHEALDPDRPITFIAPSSALVLGDAGRLAQVIGNLLANVRMHTPPHTPVGVDIISNGRVTELRVTDGGPGLPAEALDKVFERFFRVDQSRTRRTGGSGLGLAIVSAIVNAHGGTVTAANAPDGGASITLALPSAPQPA